MADTVASSASPHGPLITALNSNDVILGRGAGPGQFLGNQRFRTLVEERKEEFIQIKGHKHQAKAKISKELLDAIHTRGGRFLKPIKGIFWCEVRESVAVEKCTQALRDHRKKTERKGGSSTSSNSPEGRASESGNSSGGPPTGTSGWASTAIREAVVPEALNARVTHYGEPASLAMQHFNLEAEACLAVPAGESPLIPDARLVSPQLKNLFPVRPPQFHHNNRQAQNDARVLLGSFPLPIVSQMSMDAARVAKEEYLVDNTLASCGAQDDVPQQQATINASVQEDILGGAGQRQDPSNCTTAASSAPLTLERQDVTTAAPAQDGVSDFLLFCSQASGQQRYTKEQEEIERATMTDAEKAAALSDVFGRSCSITFTHKAKRAKLALDCKSIEYLVHQMRLELERIPLDKKQALVEAQQKANADEFSNNRLERFLRCEGMNIILGAQRFVNYWESRRQVFGPVKFVWRMTLSEALCDDLDAVETCVCRPLSNLDASGRQLLLVTPGRHTRVGYSRESMLRAIWYVTEVLSQANRDIASGVVMIVCDKDFTVWHYDGKLYERMTFFDMNCWPVKIVARHVFVAPWFVVNVIKPIRFSLIDKETRSRIQIHDVPDSQILDTLSGYGIPKEVLPTDTGGSITLDQAEWIANRRALELEEI